MDLPAMRLSIVRVLRGSLLTLVVGSSFAVGGCTRAGPGTRAPDQGQSVESVAAEGFARGATDGQAPADEDPEAVLAQAEAALSSDESARAVALFGRVLALSLPPERAASAWIGLAQAHEKLRDCVAAIGAYQTYLERFPRGEHAVAAAARRGACEAELENWEGSAATFGAIAALPDQLPSVQVEAMARQGYALFMLDRFEQADAVLAEADAIHDRAVEQQTERFSNFYFVGMTRFYRAAILHRRFRDVEIRLPEKVMEQSFQAKLALLVEAQQAYNHTVEAKHMYWVSAAGFQLGQLFSELYDALMYAPVPEWLDERQRQVYYAELEKQLRPVVTKAIWVFEKNLETARRLGYDSAFIERTEAKLGHLQAILLSDEAMLGRPGQRLARETDGDAQGPGSDASISASDRKLFVPRPTPL
ncbi:MAG: tetratricopeptide repeat protein [Deltaproteobacteria bacterium]|nr:tetratricopeptide repeat protein [Deltaproteobacteria bacterium]